MPETKLPVTEGFAGSYPVLMGSAPLSVLHSVSFVDQFDMDAAKGVQRPLDKGHAQRFRKYIEQVQQGKKATAPPLIFSLREEAKIQNGKLIFAPDKKTMARVDCQHRLEFTGDLSVPLPFIIYFNLSKEEEIEIFTTINDKHKGLTKSLVDAHNYSLAKKPEEELPHLAISWQLNNDPDSPWHDAVNTGGISQSTPGSKRTITLRTFQEANKVLISGPVCQFADYAKKYEAVKNYWQAIATIFSEAWAAPRKHLVTKGVGIAALAELGKWVIQDCLGKDDVSVAAISEYVKKLEGFDWANQTSPIKLIGGQKGAKGAAEAFKSVVFGTKEIGDLANMLVEG
jgi:DGQHR domain-containing protein